MTIRSHVKSPDLFEDASARVRRSVEEIAGEGVRIRFLHSTLVPDEETAFCVFEAESVAAIEDAYARAEVRFERLVDALRVNAGAARPQQATTRGGDRE